MKKLIAIAAVATIATGCAGQTTPAERIAKCKKVYKGKRSPTGFHGDTCETLEAENGLNDKGGLGAPD